MRSAKDDISRMIDDLHKRFDDLSKEDDDLRKKCGDLGKTNDDLVSKNNDLLKKLAQREEELREARREDLKTLFRFGATGNNGYIETCMEEQGERFSEGHRKPAHPEAQITRSDKDICNQFGVEIFDWRERERMLLWRANENLKVQRKRDEDLADYAVGRYEKAETRTLEAKQETEKVMRSLEHEKGLRRKAEVFSEEIREQFESLETRLVEEMQETTNKPMDDDVMVATLQAAYLDIERLEVDNKRLKNENESFHHTLQLSRKYKDHCFEKQVNSRFPAPSF